MPKHRHPVTINRVGSMVCPFFTDQPVIDYDSARTSDLEMFARYFGHMLDLGINLAPSQFEGMFVSTAHTDEHIERTIEAHREAMARLASGSYDQLRARRADIRLKAPPHGFLT